MEQAADWQLAHPAKELPTDWTQAVWYTGLMALARIAPTPRYRDAMIGIGEANHWELGAKPLDADFQCVGQAYAELFLQLHRPEMIAALKADFAYVLSHPQDDNLDFSKERNPTHRDRWSWCDSLFMAPPVWMRLYAATGERACRDFVVQKWWVTSNYLYDPSEHLYFRDNTYFPKREANGQKIFWSRGNGWVMAGLVRVLEYLPTDDPARPRFLRQYREMAERVIGLQPSDGLWRPSLLDAEAYPTGETSGTGLFCYALAWGVNHGVLAGERFSPGVLRAWRALGECVTLDGRLNHVQPVGGAPHGFSVQSTAAYGVGAFLLAASEIFALRASPGRGNAP